MLRRDEEGYFFVMDRIKNMYISGGENVYPAEIERFLLTFPGVSEVAVIGVPDARWGEVGKVFVVTKGLDISCEALQVYCAANLARFKVPKYLELVMELLKNDTGKINTKALKAAI